MNKEVILSNLFDLINDAPFSKNALKYIRRELANYKCVLKENSIDIYNGDKIIAQIQITEIK